MLHIGGVYEDRIASTARFIERALGLSAAVRERLILENDERGYTASEVAGIAERAGVPAVFDWLHHQINPGLPEPVEEILARLLATWRERDGPPKLHYSGKAEVGRAGAHSEWIDPADFVAFAGVVSRASALAGKHQVDCMLEAKGKDLALLRLREDLTALSA